MLIEIMPERAIALTFGSIHIYWYGVLYVIAFGLALFLLPRLQLMRQIYLTREQRIEVMAWVAFGVIVGGRLGYAIFYESKYFSEHWLKIFELWRGGMSAHGGFIGVAITLYVVSRLFKVDFWKLADLSVVVAPLGLALGRLGNFINQELYGTITSLPWAVHVPNVPGLRHPVQVYAAIADLFIAGLCYLALRSKRFREGQVTAIFLLSYGIIRFVLEYWRQPEWPLINVAGILFTRGQFLSLPIVLLGAMLLVFLWRQKRIMSK